MSSASSARQFSIFLENTPGRLAEISNTLAKSHVNIVALDVPQVSEQVVLRLIVDDPGRARSLLKREGVPFVENEVLLLDLENTPGALAVVAHKLSKARINIEYAYGSAGVISHRSRIVMQISDTLRARKLLESPPTTDVSHPFHEKPRFVHRERQSSRRR